MDNKTRDKFMRDIGRKRAYRDMAEWLRGLPILAVMEKVQRSQEEIEERWDVSKSRGVSETSRRRTRRRS